MTISADSEDNFPKARFDFSYLFSIIGKIFKLSSPEIFCEALEGDASDRSYFRVSLKTETNRKCPQSLIVMQLKDPISELETDFTRILKFFRGL